MAATISQLNALARDGVFQQRAVALILQEAAVIYGENPAVANHATRSSYAVKLLQTPSLAYQLVQVLVSRTNLVASSVTYDFDKGEVFTDATDGAILAQLSSDWNMLAGV